MTASANQKPFMLGEWRVDAARGIVAQDGREIRLEPQLMELLLLFAAEPGQVLSKERIVSSVWQGRAIGDDTLAAAISRLRAALGARKYIETIPKRGYRLTVGNAEEAKPPKRGRDDSPAARGFAILKSPSPLALGQARLYFEAAICDDAGHAEAHAGLAETLLLEHLTGQGALAGLVQAARAAAQTALAHDQTLAIAWATLGFAILLDARAFDEADRAFLKALALDPDCVLALRYRGLALAAAGRLGEAERALRRAVALDPLSLSARGELTQCLLLARRYGEALAQARRTLKLAPHASAAWAAKGWAHHLLGEEAEAVEAFLESLHAWGADAATLDRLAYAHRLEGMQALCARAADLFESQQVGFVPRLTDIAILRAAAGDADAALAVLDRAVAREDPYLPWVLDLPQLDRLGNDPRFARLRERARPVR